MAINECIKSQESQQPQSIREYFEDYPQEEFRRKYFEKCERCGISLDSPYPANFPKIDSEIISSGGQPQKVVQEQPRGLIPIEQRIKQMAELSRQRRQSGEQQPAPVIDDWEQERKAGAALLFAAKPQKLKPLENPESIREHLDAMPDKAGHEYIKERCRYYQIGLDKPWYPMIPEIEENRPKSVVVEFPTLFGEDTRAVSNALARCPVFAAVKERQFFKDYVVVGIVNGTKIEIKGEQFNQDDHDTFMQLVKIAEHKPFGSEVYQSVNSVLNELGRHTRQEQRKQLFEQIDRLVSTTIRVTPQKSQSVTFHLIDMASTPIMQEIEPRHKRNLTYRLNREVERFYKRDAFTLFDIQQRIKLSGRGSELAKALHLWIIGNAEQIPHKVETIRDKVGSTTKDIHRFRQALRSALDLLRKIGIINAWHIDADDKVYIERTPSESQQKYLAARDAK